MYYREKLLLQHFRHTHTPPHTLSRLLRLESCFDKIPGQTQLK